MKRKKFDEWLSITLRPGAIQHIDKPTNKQVLFCLKKDPTLIQYIKPDNRFLGFCKFALQESKLDIRVISILKEKYPHILRSLIKTFPCLLEHISDYSDYDKLCFECVSRNGLNIQYVKNQTPELQQKAIQSTWYAYIYIREPIDEILTHFYASNYWFRYIKQENYTLDFLKKIMQTDKDYASIEDALCDLTTSDINFRRNPKYFEILEKPSDKIILNFINTGLFLRNPTVMLDHFTDEVLINSVRKNAYWLTMISPERLTYEICLEAVKQNGDIIQNVSIPLRDYNLYYEAVKSKCQTLAHVPPEIMTYDMCEKAIKQDRTCIRYVVNEFKDYNLCLLAAQSPNMRPDYILLSYQYYGHSTIFPSFPLDIVDYDLCYECVKTNPFEIRYIPEKFMNYELCLLAITKCGYAIEYIQNIYKTPELINVASQTCKQVVFYIPNELQTYDLWLLSISESGYRIAQVPEKFVDDNMLLVALKTDYNMPQQYYGRFDNYEFCKKALAIHPLAIQYIKPDYRMPNYDLWITHMKENKNGFGKILWALPYPDIIDEYLYFVAFFNKQLCFKCFDTQFIPNNYCRIHQCTSCMLHIRWSNDFLIGSDLRLPRLKRFFQSVPALRMINYFYVAQDLQLKTEDSVLQHMVTCLPKDIIKMIVLHRYNLDPYKYVRKESIQILYDNLFMKNIPNKN